MGANNLFKIIETFSPNAIVRKQLSDYRNKTVALDMFNIIYKAVLAIKNQNKKDLITSDGHVTSHLYGVFVKIMSLLNHNIRPVCVFDGKPPMAKEEALQKRRKRRQEAKDELATLDETADAELRLRLEKKQYVLTSEQVDEIKKMLRLMGIVVIEAPEEADSQCSYLFKNGDVDAVMSEDADLLAYGTEILITKYNSKYVEEVNLNVALKNMNMSKKMFIVLCILLGTDYNPPLIRGISPVKLTQYFLNKNVTTKIGNEITSIIESISSISGVTLHEDYVNIIKKVYNVYRKPIVTPNIAISYKYPREADLINYLHGEMEFSLMTLKMKLEQLIKFYKKTKNRKLSPENNAAQKVQNLSDAAVQAQEQAQAQTQEQEQEQEQAQAQTRTQAQAPAPPAPITRNFNEKWKKNIKQ